LEEAPVKPAPFEYAAPASVDEALGLLGDDARVLAGGQSLVPLLNFRLARPERLVDINGLSELAYLRASDGRLRIGALTRQAALERSPLVAERWPLLAQAIRLVGHPQIRNRGTVGGSIAHADPAAELPVAFSALDARLHAASGRGTRTIAAGDFFLGPLTTALEPDELLTEIEVPPLPDGARTAFVEHARTHGDFAIAGAAVVVAPGADARIALLGAGPAPLRAGDAERALREGADAREAARLAAALVDHDHRAALVAGLVREAIERASP
jgi:CO/xanthine dehydrogenase FAD-binding subunit